jgi:hypothetical protein
MPTTVSDDMLDLELALLKRGLDGLTATSQRCSHCHRSLLVGERIYIYESGAAGCELCRPRQRTEPTACHTVHGPEFGHTLRIIDQRGATQR